MFLLLFCLVPEPIDAECVCVCGVCVCVCVCVCTGDLPSAMSLDAISLTRRCDTSVFLPTARQPRPHPALAVGRVAQPPAPAVLRALLPDVGRRRRRLRGRGPARVGLYKPLNAVDP